MLRIVLATVLATALAACGATPSVTPHPGVPAPQPTAQIVQPSTQALMPTAPPGASAPAPAPPAAPPAYQAAPGPALAATAAVLMDTPVLEPTPTPAPPPTAEPPTAQPPIAEQPVAAPEPAAEPPPAAAARGVSRIEIAAIELDRAPAEVSVDASGAPFVPKHDVAWYAESGAPGEGENIVLWGHALRFRDSPDIPAPFGRISELAPGDRIVLYGADGAAHAYRIARQVWATPDQVAYILPTGREMVTLVSCIGDRVVTERGVSMSHRLITLAEPDAAP